MEKPDTHLPEKKKSTQREAGRVAFRGGSYSLLISLVVLAILVVVNVFVSALPTNLTKYDISSSKLYSITSNTKVVVNGLEDDVTIYWIVQSGEEDQVIENLLGKYESLSEHISVVKRSPGRISHLCPTVYGRDRLQQQPGGGMRGSQPLHQLR